MSFDLSSIQSGGSLRPPRIVLLGVEKIGKTTFAAGSDAPIILPIKGEEGCDDPDIQAKAQVSPVCNTLDDALGWLYALYAQEHDRHTVVLDSASALEPVVWQHVCQQAKVDSIEKVGGGYGKGYIEAANVWRTITEALDGLRNWRNMASIVIGHVKVKRFDDPAGDSYDQYQFDIHDKVAALLFRWADVILFANTRVVVRKEDIGFGKEKKRGIDVSGGARFLYTQKQPAHPGGGRGVFGRLPYELPLSWQAFMDAVSSASA